MRPVAGSALQPQPPTRTDAPWEGPDDPVVAGHGVGLCQ